MANPKPKSFDATAALVSNLLKYAESPVIKMKWPMNRQRYSNIIIIRVFLMVIGTLIGKISLNLSLTVVNDLAFRPPQFIGFASSDLEELGNQYVADLVREEGVLLTKVHHQHCPSPPWPLVLTRTSGTTNLDSARGYIPRFCWLTLARD